MKKVKGFTLIELMIVVVIVAILAAIAIPSYQNSIQQTRRSDAREALTRIAAMQERFFFTNNRYGTLVELGFGGPTIRSQEDFYNVNLLGGLVVDGRPVFTVQATATGAQVNDVRCQTFTLNQAGQRRAADSDGANRTDVCW